MKRYFFGYLFVRFAKIIAILALIGSGGWSLARYWQGSLEADSVRYERAPALRIRLAALSEDLARTRGLLADFKRQENVGSATRIPSEAPIDEKGFQNLDARLEDARNEVSSLKSGLVGKFDETVADIEGKLRSHAASLANQLTAGRPPAPNASPAPPAPALTAPKSLYTLLERSDLSVRRESFEQSKELLAALRLTTEHPQNATILATALAQIEQLERLLPATLETPPSKTVPSAAGSPSPPAPKLNAERIADQLQQVRRVIAAALLSDWSVDQALDEATESATAESTRCREADLLLKQLWLGVWLSIGGLLLGGVIMAFLIRVIADLIEAHLDAASHTGIVASAYQNPGSADAE